MSSMLHAALASLPHGPEFRFVDRLLELNPGKSALGEYTVRPGEPFLAGHFPGEPLFPGVLLIEAAAQLAGIVAQSDPASHPKERLRLTALRSVKILDTAKPNQTFQIQAEMIQRLGHLIQAKATVAIAGKIIMQTEITLSAERLL